MTNYSNISYEPVSSVSSLLVEYEKYSLNNDFVFTDFVSVFSLLTSDIVANLPTLGQHQSTLSINFRIYNFAGK